MARQHAGGISWTEQTWNPVTGCTRVSSGCQHCYAERLAAGRLMHHPRYAGTASRGRWTGHLNLHWNLLDQPLRWRKPSLVFVCSMSDLFHEAVPEGFLELLSRVMERPPQHTYQLLTKRPERMQAFLPGRLEPPLPNLWVGVSVEDQESADKRIPPLLKTPAVVRWLSVEPMLAGMCIDGYLDAAYGPSITWVVCGGESGPDARPMDPSWASDLRDQCTQTGVPFWMKQMGSVWATAHNARWPDGRRDTHGACMENWPLDLRIRQWPVGFTPPGVGL